MERRERARGPLNRFPTCPAENTERRAFESFKGGPLDFLTVPTTISHQLRLPRCCVQIHPLGNAGNFPRALRLECKGPAPAPADALPPLVLFQIGLSSAPGRGQARRPFATALHRTKFSGVGQPARFLRRQASESKRSGRLLQGCERHLVSSPGGLGEGGNRKASRPPRLKCRGQDS